METRSDKRYEAIKNWITQRPRLKKLILNNRAFIVSLCNIFYPPKNDSTITLRAPCNDTNKKRYYAYFGDGKALVGVHYGSHLLLDLQDNSLAPAIMLTGWWEPAIDVLLHSIVKPGNVVVDVGANVGYHTNLMGKLVEHYGKVFSFECNPALVTLLKRSIFINGFSERTQLYHAAAQDEQGECHIEFAPQMAGGGGMNQEFSGDKNSVVYQSSTYSDNQGKINWAVWGDYHHYQVKGVTLDSTVGQSTKHIDVLHMDAEGAEPLIILGAKRLISESKNLKIISEWSPAKSSYNDHEKKRKEAVDFLVSEKFSFYLIKNAKRDPYSSAPCLVKLQPADLFTIPHSDILMIRD